MPSSVYFLSLADPAAGLGVWLRFTRCAAATELWAMITLPGTPPAVVAHRVPVPTIEWSEAGLSLAIGEAVLTADGTCGAIGDGASRVTWTLAWAPSPEPVSFFPYDWMYRAPWPTTKYTVPGQALRCHGTLQVGEHRFVIAGAPGHLGHTWGAALAAAWGWAQSSACVEGDGAFEALSARVPLGPFLSPPLTLVRVRVDREVYRFDRWTQWCRHVTRWHRDGWTLEAVAGALRLHAELRVDPGTVVGVTYTEMSGDRRYCYNSVLGDATIELAERHGVGWTTRHRLTCRRTMTYEHVGRAPDPHLPLHL